MKGFYAFVTETLSRPVVVKAENQEEAEQKVIDAYYNGKFVLEDLNESIAYYDELIIKLNNVL